MDDAGSIMKRLELCCHTEQKRTLFLKISKKKSVLFVCVANKGRYQDRQTVREKRRIAALEDFPEVGAVGRQMATAAEIMNGTGQQISGSASIRIEMSVEWLAVSVDGNQKSISLKGTLKNKLLIGQKQGMIISITEGFAFPVSLGTGRNPLS